MLHTAVAPGSFDYARSASPATNPYIACVPWLIWNAAGGCEVRTTPADVVKGETILFGDRARIIKIRHNDNFADRIGGVASGSKRSYSYILVI